MLVLLNYHWPKLHINVKCFAEHHNVSACNVYINVLVDVSLF